jgi:thiamine-monophosphate kinase
MRNTVPNEDFILAQIAKRTSASHAPSSTQSLALGIGDDAALFRPKPGNEVILTSDWFLEGTHFLMKKHPPESAGWKCLARALSDVAAMGGSPRCFLLSLALPLSRTGLWLHGFLSGLRRASVKFNCILAGGDTTRQEQILISITVIGEVRKGDAVLRSGARPGNIIYVSGRLGEAELGLRILQRSGRLAAGDALLRKHLYPEPRLALGSWLAEKRIASSMMDISDGLSSDLPRLCAASGVGARLEWQRIPCVHHSIAPRALSLDPLQLALHGGDDYELLFTVSPRSTHRIPKSFHGLRLTAIGEITRGHKLQLLRKDGSEQPLVAGGWDPFRSSKAR